MGRVNIEINDETHRIAKAVCAMEGITLIEFINNAIKKKIEKQK